MSTERSNFICLVRIKTPEGERSHLVEKFPVKIGRSQDCDLVIAHSSASRHHASVVFNGNHLEIEDHRSSNGTFVNLEKAPTEKALVLEPETSVKFGSGSEIFYFQLIPRPMEMLDLESQRQTLKANFKNVVHSLEIHARFEMQDALMKEMLNKRQALEAELEQTIKQSFQRWQEEERTKVQNELSLLRAQTIEKLSSDVANQNQQLEQEKTALETRLRQVEQEKMAQFQSDVAQRKAQVEFEIHQMQTQARAQAEEEQKQIISSYQSQIKDLMARNDALLEAKENADVATQEADQKLLKMEEKLSSARLALEGLEAELQLKKQEFQMISAQATEIEKKAQQTSKELGAKLAQQEREALEKTHQALREAQNKALQINTEARASADQLLKDAHVKVDALLTESRDEASRLRRDAMNQADQIVSQARQDAEEQAQKLREQMNQNLADERQVLLQKVMTETQNERDQILQQMNASLKLLKNEEISLRESVAKIQASAQSEQVQLKDLQSQVRASSQEKENLDKSLEAQQENLKRAQNQIEQGQLAAQQREKAERDLDHLLGELTRLQLKFNEDTARVKSELKQQQDTALLAFEEEKRSLAKQLTEQRLKSLQELEQQIQSEEKKRAELRQQHANEIARTIEVRMADHLQAYIKSSEHIGSASRELFQLAKAVLSEDISQFKSQSFKIHETQEAQQRERRKWRTPAIAGLFVIFLGLFYWQKSNLQSYFQGHEQNSIAEQVIEQRRIQSIYQPPQDSKLRDNYTDNVLYNSRYLIVKSDPDYQKAWSLRLNDMELIKKWNLNEDKMIQYQAAQNALVKQLEALRQQIDAVYLNEGLERMRKAEMEEHNRMKAIVKNDSTLRGLEELEQSFMQSYFQAHPPTSR